MGGCRIYILTMDEKVSPYQVSESGMAPVSEQNQPPAGQSSIPKVFGIIHIVYAAFGIILSLASVVALFAAKAFVGSLEGEGNEFDAMFDELGGLMIYIYMDAAVKVILGVVLLIAGIGLLKKKLWAKNLSVFWAVAWIVAAVGMTLLTMGPAREFNEKMSETGGSQQEQFQQALQGAGNIVGIIFVCIYPVLTMIFLTKKHVTDSLNSSTQA